MGFYGVGRQLSVNPCYNMKLLQLEVMLTVTFLALPGDVNTASGPFPRSQFFASGGKSIGVSASASGNEYWGAKIKVVLDKCLSGGYRAETSP